MVERALEDKIKYLDARIQDTYALLRQILHCYADTIDISKRVFDVEQRIEAVYLRLCDFVNYESITKLDADRAEKAKSDILSIEANLLELIGKEVSRRLEGPILHFKAQDDSNNP